MSTNEAQMRALAEGLYNFLLEGKKASVRFTHRNLVRATPKRTGFASGWVAGVGGPPPIEPGRPTRPRYGIPGDVEIDQVVGGAALGEDITLVSPAIYIRALAKPNRPRWGSDQQPKEGWIQDAIDDAGDRLATWRFK